MRLYNTHREFLTYGCGFEARRTRIDELDLNVSRSRSKLFNCQTNVGCLDLQIRRRLEGSLPMRDSFNSRDSTSHHQLTRVSVKVNKGGVLESEATPSLQEVAWKEVGWLHDFTETSRDRRVIGGAVTSMNSIKEFLRRLLHGFLFPLLSFLVIFRSLDSVGRG